MHHDVASLGFNPGVGKPSHLPFPAPDGDATLVIAQSVFTHVYEAAAAHYLRECARVLAIGGWAWTTWFLFDKAYFPMMQEFQNTLFINEIDPTNAVIYDRTWLLRTLDDVGLALAAAHPPTIRGFQWTLVLVDADHPAAGATLPEEEEGTAFGLARPPAHIVDPHLVGRTTSRGAPET